MLESPCHDSGLTLQESYSQVDMDNKDRVLGASVDRGAYEVDCSDVSNPLDWNADGLVNLYEFNYFSRSWLSHDPNDPAWLADPNLADPNLSEGWYEWKYKCNLDATGSSAYSIDLPDLMVFCEDAPQNWLWKACWITEGYLSEMMSGGEQSMQASSSTGQMVALNSFEQISALNVNAQISVTSADVIGTEEMQAIPEPVVQPEPSVEEQILELKESIEFLEQIWQEEPNIQWEINADEWQEFMEAVHNSLLELQTQTVQIE